MAINSLGATTQVNNLQGNSLGMQDFLKILLTQLNYQDPMKPMDNQQFMAQMAQFSTLQQTQQLNTNIEKLVNNQAALQSVGLIGKTVDVVINGSSVSGQVVSLYLGGNSPSLTLALANGTKLNDVGLDQIVTVR